MKYLYTITLISLALTLSASASQKDCVHAFTNKSTYQTLDVKQHPFPIQHYKYYAKMYGGELHKDSFDLPWLKTFLKNNSTIDSFLSNLPESLRQSHTLVMQSSSTQFGSPELPRVILSNSDSTFLLSYSNDPQQRGFFSLEGAIFDRTQSRFTPFEIAISEIGKLQRLQINPTKCIACHGENFRPIWGAYSFWPKFYGSFSRPSSSFAESVLVQENKAYSQFLSNEREKGRYQALIGRQSISSLEELNAAMTFNFTRLNTLRIITLIEKIIALQPHLYGLIKFSIQDLANNSKVRDISERLSQHEKELYKRKSRELILDTRSKIESAHLNSIRAHLNSLGMDPAQVTLDNLWNSEIGIVHHDAGVLFNEFRSQEKNLNSLENYILKLANLRFVVESLGASSLSDWSMTKVEKSSENLPLLATPLEPAWRHLLHILK